jgi:hypothetical protein
MVRCGRGVRRTARTRTIATNPASGWPGTVDASVLRLPLAVTAYLGAWAALLTYVEWSSGDGVRALWSIRRRDEDAWPGVEGGYGSQSLEPLQRIPAPAIHAREIEDPL